jgi:hypothetical protein
MRSLDVKWPRLDSTLLLNSALKFITLYWQIAVFSRRIATKENCHTADCYSQRSELESGMPKAWTARRVRIRPESGGWQSAVRLRADCQAVILIVANCGIGARSLAIQWIPAPAILHREAPCLRRRIFLMRDFTSLKLIRGILFGPKLNTNGFSWHTISWHYTFKNYKCK